MEKPITSSRSDKEKWGVDYRGFDYRMDNHTTKDNKEYPVAGGVLDYFPLAILEVARVSYIGSKQHGHETMHWDRSKSQDEADALMRHFLKRGTLDDDGVRHSAKLAWRALALLQKELEKTGYL